MGKVLEAAMPVREAMDKAGAMLTDEQAESVMSLYKPWRYENENGKPVEYEIGDRRTYGGFLYRCLIAHEAQKEWTPVAAVSLWTKVLTSDTGEILPWEQPDSTNAYKLGDKVTHKGKTWVCTDVDGAGNNTWEPGVYGWTEVVDE